MVWLFHKKPDPVDNVLAELSPQSKEYFKSQDRTHYDHHAKDTGFTVTNSILSESSQINCAEYQQRFMSCLSNGQFKERMLGCNEKQQEWDLCMKQQMDLFHKLGLQYVKDQHMYEQGVMIADSLRGSDEDQILDNRDQLWKS
jgi:hypothetical protein